MTYKAKAEARRKLFALQSSDSIPEPCMSCGRTDQPERFHTHPPKTPLAGGASGTRIPVRLGTSPQKEPKVVEQQNSRQFRAKA